MNNNDNDDNDNNNDNDSLLLPWRSQIMPDQAFLLTVAQLRQELATGELWNGIKIRNRKLATKLLPPKKE
ncbi:hypothetical protein [Candidatus Nitrososphaera gargensis]|uniref:hypothetical protein n=1 Tax=Candidatus Nitrososphaera gargensis TaxID=497727 RepID=UPI0011E516C1|nr:hypothetical protein [Candidatus Nitrososphaera gargensis]